MPTDNQHKNSPRNAGQVRRTNAARGSSQTRHTGQTQSAGSPRSVSLAQKAGANGRRGDSKKGRSTKHTKKNKTVIGILVAVIVVALVFVVLGIHYVYQTVAPQGETSTADPYEHAMTPDSEKSKVAYYLFGLLGSDDNTGTTDMLSVICFDKERKTVNILQFPQDTYIGDSDQWAVSRIGNVWGNPKPIDWCPKCRCAVSSSEISDGKHTVCGTTITQMTGSPAEDLCKVINKQYGLPVDATIMVPQKALVKLVNLVGGIDVNLESKMKVNDIQYNTGVQTLDGDAALYYATNRGSGISGDIDLLIRQRKVFLAIFQRLAKESEDKLTNDTIGPLMNGSTPFRLSGPSENNSTFSRMDIIKLIMDMNKVSLSSMTAYVVPGESAKKGGSTYFSLHKADMLSLLNDAFVPYGDKLADSKLGLTEISSKQSADTHKQMLSDIAAAQSGAVTTTAATTG